MDNEILQKLDSIKNIVLSDDDYKKDGLYRAACIYNQLEPIEYRIGIGRKKTENFIIIKFLPDRFKHLVGVDHLENNHPFQQYSSENFLNACLSGNCLLQTMMESEIFYSENLYKRIWPIQQLDYLIENDNTIFKYNSDFISTQNFNSRIKANYLIDCISNGNLPVFVFLKDIYSTKEKKAVYLYSRVNSIFEKESFRDYTKSQSKWFVLYKDIRNLSKSNEWYRFYTYSGYIKNKFNSLE